MNGLSSQDGAALRAQALAQSILGEAPTSSKTLCGEMPKLKFECTLRNEATDPALAVAQPSTSKETAKKAKKIAAERAALTITRVRLRLHQRAQSVKD